MLQRSLSPSTLVVAIDPGKVSHRVWLSTDAAGLVTEPLMVPVLRPGLEALDKLVRQYSGGEQLVFAVDATGGLHRAGVSELNRRFPAAVRVSAPAETAAVPDTTATWISSANWLMASPATNKERVRSSART